MARSRKSRIDGIEGLSLQNVEGELRGSSAAAAVLTAGTLAIVGGVPVPGKAAKRGRESKQPPFAKLAFGNLRLLLNGPSAGAERARRWPAVAFRN